MHEIKSDRELQIYLYFYTSLIELDQKQKQ